MPHQTSLIAILCVDMPVFAFGMAAHRLRLSPLVAA